MNQIRAQSTPSVARRELEAEGWLSQKAELHGAEGSGLVGLFRNLQGSWSRI